MNSPSRDDYIFKQAERRETEAVERLLLFGPTREALRRDLWDALGWLGGGSWYALRIPTDLVLPPDLAKQYPGDIDIMGGPLSVEENDDYRAALTEIERALPGAMEQTVRSFAWGKILADGKMTWPPPLARIGAAETKCSYIDAGGTVKATGAGSIERINRQAAKLAAIGFDRVALLWIVVNEPVWVEGAGNIGQWAAGADLAWRGSETIVAALRPDDAHEFGQLVLAAGSVPGRAETSAGSCSLRVVRPPADIHRAAGSTQAVARKHVQDRLEEFFRSVPVPTTAPVIVRACAPGGCGRLFIAAPPANRLCPGCGRNT